MKWGVKKVGRLIDPNASQRIISETKKTLDIAIKQINADDIARTRSGKDIRGQYFKGYVPAYAKQRRKEGLQTSPVNLTRTRKLLDSIKTSVSFGSNRFTVTREIDPSMRKIAEGLSKKRQFFGLTKKANEILKKLFDQLNLKNVLR